MDDYAPGVTWTIAVASVLHAAIIPQRLNCCNQAISLIDSVHPKLSGLLAGPHGPLPVLTLVPPRALGNQSSARWRW